MKCYLAFYFPKVCNFTDYEKTLFTR